MNLAAFVPRLLYRLPSWDNDSQYTEKTDKAEIETNDAELEWYKVEQNDMIVFVSPKTLFLKVANRL